MARIPLFVIDFYGHHSFFCCWWGVMESNHPSPKATGLQPAPLPLRNNSPFSVNGSVWQRRQDGPLTPFLAVLTVPPASRTRCHTLHLKGHQRGSVHKIDPGKAIPGGIRPTGGLSGCRLITPDHSFPSTEEGGRKGRHPVLLSPAKKQTSLPRKRRSDGPLRWLRVPRPPLSCPGG